VRRSYLLLGIVLLAACAPSGVSEEAVQTALVVIAAERTREAAAEPSATPAPPTQEATASTTPEPTQAGPTDPHEDGLYLVGADIAPGLWRSTASDQRFCYWARRKYDGVVLASYYGLPGGELLVHSDDYEVELDGCGTWIYVGPR
jgi:hypothetical protein